MKDENACESVSESPEHFLRLFGLPLRSEVCAVASELKTPLSHWYKLVKPGLVRYLQVISPELDISFIELTFLTFDVQTIAQDDVYLMVPKFRAL